MTVSRDALPNPVYSFVVFLLGTNFVQIFWSGILPFEYYVGPTWAENFIQNYCYLTELQTKECLVHLNTVTIRSDILERLIETFRVGYTEFLSSQICHQALNTTDRHTCVCAGQGGSRVDRRRQNYRTCSDSLHRDKCHSAPHTHRCLQTTPSKHM